MTKRKITAFPWYGGKNIHLNWLLPFINGFPHTTYVESFGGSAAVLLNKKPSLVEVYNDSYGEVVNFFRVLRGKKDEFIPLLEMTPYSREEFNVAKSGETDISDVERARRFFVLVKQSRNAMVDNSGSCQWAYTIEHSRRKMASGASKWLAGIDGLKYVCSRLKQVQIENKDAIDVIQRYDTPKTLHYVDPPYLMSTRTHSGGYSHEFDENKHVELLNLIKSLEGKVILSGYDNEMYNDALIGWHKYKDKIKYSFASSHKGKNESALRQEVIWMNYELNVRPKGLFDLSAR